jgi:hypothetical protein
MGLGVGEIGFRIHKQAQTIVMRRPTFTIPVRPALQYCWSHVLAEANYQQAVSRDGIRTVD